MNKFKLFTLFLLIMSPSAFGDQKIKNPNVSGQFYTADPKVLSAQIEKYIASASVHPINGHIDIVIAPHAGYVYSGSVAAYSFKAVSQKKYNTVVILAPSHHFGFDGISVWKEGGFKTPLGVVDVDADFAAKLIGSHEKIYYKPEIFEKEHSLEVEIPFLQKTYSQFKIVPIIFGQPSFDMLNIFSQKLASVIGDRKDVLIVVSTDFSHYHPDHVARKMDKEAVEAIKNLEAEAIFNGNTMRTMEMCGFVPVTAAVLYARLKGLNAVEELKYANSGDVNKDKERVVGYSSIVFYKASDKGDHHKSAVSGLSLEQKRKLLAIARKTMEDYVRHGRVSDIKENDARLNEVEGAFVTIHKNGQLRGCIGNIIGKGPLCLTVRDMAVSSATQDPRFPPLKEEELSLVELEVSVLSKPWRVYDVNEIKMGVHGVIVSQGPFKRGVFVPQVATETGWSREEFLSQLCSQKAGLAPDAWKNPKTVIEIFTAEVFSESDIREKVE